MGGGVRQADTCTHTHGCTHWDHIVCREKLPGNIQMGSGYNSKHSSEALKTTSLQGIQLWSARGMQVRDFQGSRELYWHAAHTAMQWWNAPLCSHGLGTGYSHAAPGSWGTIFPCRWETISIFSTCCSVGIRNASAYTTEIMCETESYCSLFFFICVNQR